MYSGLAQARPKLVSVCTATQKASVGMYSGCDMLSGPINLVLYFLALPSLLHPSILFNCFYTCYCSFFGALGIAHDFH